MKRLLLLLLLAAGPVQAVEPDEMLADPALEARAQALDADIRCVQCRSENIASSNSDWARDARLMVRELIAGGKSDAEVTAFFVDRYGDFVLMRPRAEGGNLLLWLAAPGLLVAGGLIAVAYIRRRRGTGAENETAPELGSDERARLKELMGE